MVERQLGWRRRWGQRLGIQCFVEDGVDGAVGKRADLEAASAGGLEAIGTELAGEPENAETGAEALLGMRAAAQDDLDEGRGVGTDPGGFAEDALVGPAGVAAMGRGHVLGHGRVTAARAAEQVASNALALVEQLDGARGDAGLE